MVSSRPNVEIRFPIYEAVSRRFKNTKLPPICYPVGLAAYFSDQLLTFGVKGSIIAEELKYKQLRLYNDQQPRKVSQPIDVAIDALVTNKFWMTLESEIKDSKIYDAETFFVYMRSDSPYSKWIGNGEEPTKTLCNEIDKGFTPEIDL